MCQSKPFGYFFDSQQEIDISQFFQNVNLLSCSVDCQPKAVEGANA